MGLGVSMELVAGVFNFSLNKVSCKSVLSSPVAR